MAALVNVPPDGASPDESVPKQISVSDVDRELDRAWKSLAAIRGDVMALRSCTLNVVTLVPDARQAGTASSAIGSLAAVHPIRAITVVEDAEAPEEAVRAWVGVDGSKGSADHACGAEIMLRAHPDSGPRALSAVRGLLAADLPVALWWRGGPPLRAPLFASMAAFADKIIVDSVRFGDGEAGLDTLRRLIEYDGRRAAIGDLNWERIAAWRLSIAACFDHADVLALLPELDRCTIEFATNSVRTTPASARALLLAGWLTDRVPRLARRIRLNARRDEHPLTGSILRVVLSSSNSGCEVAVSWAGSAEDMSAAARGPAGQEVRSWKFSRDTQSEAELLHRCVDELARDPLLEAALT
ncbi:MAG: glucose-6-phosphate dehydrogenase assembly protein OpcA [Candidatus Eremiobacteraeota bacterium]|nr:glucose-6-phosphate dehydrogenase assembly protein OpcA [Candidatus Eremiobacteraeota bacterium]MBC5827356.1 glucose-6-phosphate dehydrogenase assembly protein OpcA [Candidatus Eremiobacteraeota bacterium]